MKSTLSMIVAIFLLCPSPSFAQYTHPAGEYLDGNRNTFVTKSHPKSAGTDFVISYPASWASLKGDRPNVMQKFVSEGGHGLESIAIGTIPLPLPTGYIATTQELEALLAPSELRQMLPADAIFVDAQSTRIEGDPAGIVEYILYIDRAGTTLLLHTWSIWFMSGNTLVHINFQVGGLAGMEADVAERMAAFKPLFTLVANSIVFPNKRVSTGNAPAASRDPQDHSTVYPYDGSSLLFLTAAVSMLITWGIGLTPPLIVRYILMKRPLDRKIATRIAASFSVLFFILFTVANGMLADGFIESKDIGRTGAVWVIIFFVSRWIMSRGTGSLAAQEKALA